MRSMQDISGKIDQLLRVGVTPDSVSSGAGHVALPTNVPYLVAKITSATRIATSDGTDQGLTVYGYQYVRECDVYERSTEVASAIVDDSDANLPYGGFQAIDPNYDASISGPSPLLPPAFELSGSPDVPVGAVVQLWSSSGGRHWWFLWSNRERIFMAELRGGLQIPWSTPFGVPSPGLVYGFTEVTALNKDDRSPSETSNGGYVPVANGRYGITYPDVFVGVVSSETALNGLVTATFKIYVAWANGGTFKLLVGGLESGISTAIPWNVIAATLESTLNASFATQGSWDVAGVNPFLVTYTSDFAGVIILERSSSKLRFDNPHGVLYPSFSPNSPAYDDCLRGASDRFTKLLTDPSIFAAFGLENYGGLLPNACKVAGWWELPDAVFDAQVPPKSAPFKNPAHRTVAYIEEGIHNFPTTKIIEQVQGDGDSHSRWLLSVSGLSVDITSGYGQITGSLTVWVDGTPVKVAVSADPNVDLYSNLKAAVGAVHSLSSYSYEVGAPSRRLGIEFADTNPHVLSVDGTDLPSAGDYRVIVVRQPEPEPQLRKAEVCRGHVTSKIDATHFKWENADLAGAFGFPDRTELVTPTITVTGGPSMSSGGGTDTYDYSGGVTIVLTYKTISTVSVVNNLGTISGVDFTDPTALAAAINGADGGSAITVDSDSSSSGPGGVWTTTIVLGGTASGPAGAYNPFLVPSPSDAMVSDSTAFLDVLVGDFDVGQYVWVRRSNGSLLNGADLGAIVNNPGNRGQAGARAAWRGNGVWDIWVYNAKNGTWALSIDGTVVNSSIPWNATATQLQTYSGRTVTRATSGGYYVYTMQLDDDDFNEHWLMVDGRNLREADQYIGLPQAFRWNGLPTFTNTDAPNSGFFYSSTDSKAAYKDGGGTVHDLY